MLSNIFVFAGTPQKGQKPGKRVAKTAKVMDVWTCPVSLHKSIKDKGSVVGKYRVHFCCADCPKTFAKLSRAQKKSKVKAAILADKKSKEVSENTDTESITPEESKNAETKTVALTDLWKCPISGGEVKDKEAAKSEAVVVGKYRVHFCCPGCPSQFAKLSDAEKKDKIAAIAE